MSLIQIGILVGLYTVPLFIVYYLINMPFGLFLVLYALGVIVITKVVDKTIGLDLSLPKRK